MTDAPRAKPERDSDAARDGTVSDTSAAPRSAHASLENADPQSAARANRVELIGCDERFWQLGSGRPQQLPQPREIVLNQPLAERLGVRCGRCRAAPPAAARRDSRRQRLGQETRDGPHATADVSAKSFRPKGWGASVFGPRNDCRSNAYVSLEWLQQRLDQPGRANAILVAEREGDSPFRGSRTHSHGNVADTAKSGQSPANGCLRPTRRLWAFTSNARRWATGTSLPTA